MFSRTRGKHSGRRRIHDDRFAARGDSVGMLIVEPDDSVIGGVWQPTIQAIGRFLSREDHRASGHGFKRCELHFTTDGTNPTKASPHTQAPSSWLRARPSSALPCCPTGGPRGRLRHVHQGV